MTRIAAILQSSFLFFINALYFYGVDCSKNREGFNGAFVNCRFFRDLKLMYVLGFILLGTLLSSVLTNSSLVERLFDGMILQSYLHYGRTIGKKISMIRIAKIIIIVMTLLWYECVLSPGWVCGSYYLNIFETKQNKKTSKESDWISKWKRTGRISHREIELILCIWLNCRSCRANLWACIDFLRELELLKQSNLLS